MVSVFLPESIPQCWQGACTLHLDSSCLNPYPQAQPLRIITPKAGYTSPVLLPTSGKVATICLPSSLTATFSQFLPSMTHLTSFDKSPSVHTCVILTALASVSQRTLALSRIPVFFGPYMNPMTYFLPNSIWWLLLEITPKARVTVFSKQNYRMSSQAEQWMFSVFVV